MSDTFLPGSGFDTYEEQDKVLVGLCGGRGCRAAVRILQQQAAFKRFFCSFFHIRPHVFHFYIIPPGRQPVQ